MKKKPLPPAQAPLPNFQSDKEAAEYFEAHSMAAVWDQLVPEQIAAAKKIPRQSRLATKRNCAWGLPREFGAKRRGVTRWGAVSRCVFSDYLERSAILFRMAILGR